MLKKAYILLLSAMVFLLSFALPVKEKAHADILIDSTAHVLEGTIGERVLNAVAEKAGINYATKEARELAVKRWNMDLYNKVKEAANAGDSTTASNYQSLADYMKNLDSSAVTPDPNKSGFGTVLVKSAMFLTGADLLYDGAKALNTAVQSKIMFGYMDQLSTAVGNGTVLLSYKGLSAFDNPSQSIWGFGTPDMSGSWVNIWNSSVDFSLPHWIEVTVLQDTGTSVQLQLDGKYQDTFGNIQPTSSTDNFTLPSSPPDFQELGIIPDSTVNPDVSNPMPWVTSNPDPATLPDTISVEIPLDNTYPDTVTTPWNDPQTDLAPAPAPAPAPDPTPAGPVTPFIPLTLLMALLDLLRAILMYLGRMFTFIGTIPFIPAKNINNEAFEWFKTASIVGVPIYSVVSSLASIGLAFMVYKPIRRLFQ